MKIHRFPTCIFVAQPEYFRQNYADAVFSGEHYEFPVASGSVRPYDGLVGLVKKVNAKVVVFVRPEWICRQPFVFDELKKIGVKLVGYATEPIPLNGQVNPHPDLILRKSSLAPAASFDWDLMIFYDKSSSEEVVSLGFPRVDYHLLPLSFTIFRSEPSKKEFDAVFFGRYTEYRESFLMPLKVARQVVHVAHGLHDEWAQKIMSKAHCVLNVHNLDYRNFETRVVQGLLCEVPVLSQPLTQTVLNSHELFTVFNTKEELVALVENVINDPPKLKNFRNHLELLSPFHVNSFFQLLLGRL